MSDQRNIRFTGMIWLMIVLVSALAGCQGSPSPTGGPTSASATATGEVQPTSPGLGTFLADVNDVEVRLLESFPVQVNVIARGNLSDSCTAISRVVEERIGSAFQVTIFAARAQDRVCAQVVTPFEEVIDLDVVGLPAGTYTVDVNGVMNKFTLQVDNGPPGEGLGSITGLVWHDLCAVAVDAAGNQVQPTPGCVRLDDATYAANGINESGEPGIAGVLVDLGLGVCPSTGFASAETGSDGRFTFSDLSLGAYCISVDPLKGQNTTILPPGSWTLPSRTGEIASYSYTLSDASPRTEIHFGWDYQFLPEPPPLPTPTPIPTPTPKPTPCDWIQFVGDVTVPDGTVFAPGASFTKIWRLRNIGTCTWTTDYDLVFVSGDRMQGPSIQPLAAAVRPGETVDVGVNLFAPSEVGDYRGNWQLRNASGVLFGTGENAQSSFFVDIDVKEVNRVPFYNFAEAYCDATWMSGTGNVPCQGSTETKDGFVQLLENPALENRVEDEPALWVHPNHSGASWIQGTYPALRVQDGDRFRTWIGCLAESQGCDVRFELGYFNENGVYKILGEWHEVFDGKATVLDLDLSSLAGRDLPFVLRMNTANDRPDLANGFWFVPLIARVERNIP